MDKKGAMELSVSTIVIVVLSMIMLIVGSVIVKKVACTTINGIDKLDENMKESIIETFKDTNQKITFKEYQNKVPKGVEYGIGFGIKNLLGSKKEFSYKINVRDVGSCNFKKEDAEKWITLGKEDSFSIAGGEIYTSKFMLLIPENVENCKLRYTMTVYTNDKEIYDSSNVDVEIINKPLFASFC